jgi:hypothetical protein
VREGITGWCQRCCKPRRIFAGATRVTTKLTLAVPEPSAAVLLDRLSVSGLQWRGMNPTELH